MDKKRIIDDLVDLFRSCDGNTISAGIALDGCEGLVMFDEPIFGVSAADDAIYETFKKAEVIGDNFMLPGEWLPGARSIISFFLPFTQRVRSPNRGDPENTSNEWLHARIEGQAFINAYTEMLKNILPGMVSAHVCRRRTVGSPQRPRSSRRAIPR